MSCISRLNNSLELRHPFSFGIIWCNLFGGRHGPAEGNRLHCSLSHAIGAGYTVHCQTLLVQVTLFTVTRFWCRLHCSLSHAIGAGYHVRYSQSIDRLKSMFYHFAHSRIPCVLVFTLSLLTWLQRDLETWGEFWMCNVCSSWWHCAVDRMLKASHLNWYKFVVLQSRAGGGESSVVRASPGMSYGRIFFSRVNFRCWVLFQYQFYPHLPTHPTPRVTTVARKCGCRVTAKHTCNLHTWLCLKWRAMVHGCMVYREWRAMVHGCMVYRQWRAMVHGCMVYRECSKITAVWRGINHVTTKQYCKHTTWVNIQNMLLKAIVTHL